MAISQEKSIAGSLEHLLKLAADFIDKGKQQGSLTPDKETFMKFRLKNFSYSEKGVESTGSEGNYIEKDDWLKAIQFVDQHVSNQEQFKVAKEKINSTFKKNSSLTLNHFLNKFITDYFYHRTDPSQIPKLVNSFINDRKGEAVECGARVELLGLALQIPTINLDNGVRMRQITKEELEAEIPHYLVSELRYDYNYPSAVMEIKKSQN